MPSHEFDLSEATGAMKQRKYFHVFKLSMTCLGRVNCAPKSVHHVL